MEQYVILRVEQRAHGALRTILINGHTGSVIGTFYVEKIIINKDVDTEQYIQQLEEKETQS